MVHANSFQKYFILFIYLFIYVNIIIIKLNLFFEVTSYHKLTCIIWIYYKCLGDHNHAKYMGCERINISTMTHHNHKLHTLKLAIFIKITMWNQKPHHGLGDNSWEVRK